MQMTGNQKSNKKILPFVSPAFALGQDLYADLSLLSEATTILFTDPSGPIAHSKLFLLNVATDNVSLVSQSLYAF